MDRLIVVSVDSHAQAPPEAWPEYLEARYHGLIPSLHEENEIYTTVMGTLGGRVIDSPASQAVYDVDGAYRSGGWQGVWDAERRLAEMDREGVAGEFVYHGDLRATSIFHNVFNRPREPEVCDAGVRAYNRWVTDAFGPHDDRIFRVAAATSGVDLHRTLGEISWAAGNGFRGTFLPGFTSYPDTPSFLDERWEPVWATCEDLDMPLFVHAGHGSRQGAFFDAVDDIKRRLDAPGADPSDVIAWATREVFTGEFFSDVGPRRPMWQLMFGGVFDRHPNLQLVMTEVRADWLPATLRLLDAVYERHRDELPAERSPTEYWHRNCLMSLSFVHRAEVEMRHEMGIETLAFGRDYPHTESTWPNTRAWLRDAFGDVPENELRLVLGENAVRFFDLDRRALARVAERVGPSLGELVDGPPVPPELVEHFQLRGGYLKPAEGGAKADRIAEMVAEDLTAVGIRG
jgi:predicted TIM-barrel fold metal-dependent hydrolase